MGSVVEASGGDQGAATGPLLEQGSELVVDDGGAWRSTVHEGTGEASIMRDRPPASPQEWEVDPVTGELLDPDGLTPPERRELNEERNQRRAVTKVRRFSVRNLLAVTWTLTFADECLPEDARGVWREAERFVRRLREHLGEPFPYLVVCERGSKTGRLHLHLLLPVWVHDRVTSHDDRLALWGRGWVLYTDGRSKRRPGESLRDVSRRAARYAGKYVGKEVGEDREEGDHRYRCAEGFQVRTVRHTGLSVGDALAIAAAESWDAGLVPVAIGCGPMSRDGPVVVLVVGRSVTGG